VLCVPIPVLSGRGLCDELVPLPESPTDCGVSKKCVIVNPRKMRRPRPPRGSRATEKKLCCVPSCSAKLRILMDRIGFLTNVEQVPN
jgi:hypothetical protein